MKNVIVFLIIGIIIVMSVTGFQCATAEMTSGRMYVQRQDWVSAERSFEQEVAKSPNNAEGWYWLGRVRFELKDYQGMNEAFTRSVELSKEFEKEIKNIRLATWGQLFNGGVGAYLQSKTTQGDSVSILLTKSIDNFTTAILLNPDSASTYTNLGLAYLGLNDFDNAVKNFEIAINKEKDPQLSFSLGSIYLERARKIQNEIKNASNAKKDSLQKIVSGYYDKALTTLSDGEKNVTERLDGLSKKIEELRKSVDDSKKDSVGMKQLSDLQKSRSELENLRSNIVGLRLDIYIAAGRSEEAMKNFEKELEKRPNDKNLRYNLGVLLIKAGEHSRAVEQFEAAVVSDPQFEDALYNLGIGYLQWGAKRRSEAESASRAGGKEKKVDKSYEEQFRKGKDTLERLRDIKPNDPDIWEALGQAYANLNMAKAASDAFNKADNLRKTK